MHTPDREGKTAQYWVCEAKDRYARWLAGDSIATLATRRTRSGHQLKGFAPKRAQSSSHWPAGGGNDEWVANELRKGKREVRGQRKANIARSRKARTTRQQRMQGKEIATRIGGDELERLARRCGRKRGGAKAGPGYTTRRRPTSTRSSNTRDVSNDLSPHQQPLFTPSSIRQAVHRTLPLETPMLGREPGRRARDPFRCLASRELQSGLSRWHDLSGKDRGAK